MNSEIEVWPLLTFWYGLTPGDLYGLERPILAEYARQLPSLIAEYQMIHIQAAAITSMKDNDRKKLIRDLQKLAHARQGRSSRRKMSEQEFKDNAAAAGIPIEMFNPEVT